MHLTLVNFRRRVPYRIILIKFSKIIIKKTIIPLNPAAEQIETVNIMTHSTAFGMSETMA